MSETPVLLIIFNRPDRAAQVLEAIRKAAPKQLFIAADGPRVSNPDDIEKCAATRKIIERVDWECEVHTLFRDVNLGCGKAVSSAITWFFESVEYGIILEDDCLPSTSFFRFCCELLEKYEYDTRVMHISGGNSCFWKSETESSYRFSTIPSIWGWATWRRAWNYFDYNATSFPDFKEKRYAEYLYPNKVHFEKQMIKFENGYSKQINAVWGYQWQYAIAANYGLIITPSVNLVLNFGFDESSTHTPKAPNLYLNVKLEEMEFPLKHPNFIVPDYQRDIELLKMYIPKSFREPGCLRKALKCFIPESWRKQMRKLFG